MPFQPVPSLALMFAMVNVSAAVIWGVNSLYYGVSISLDTARGLSPRVFVLDLTRDLRCRSERSCATTGRTPWTTEMKE